MQYHCICLRQAVTVPRGVADFCLWDEVSNVPRIPMIPDADVGPPTS